MDNLKKVCDDKEIRVWSKETGINVMFFSLADEKWKDMNDGSVGSHRGFLTSKLSLKKAYQDLF